MQAPTKTAICAGALTVALFVAALNISSDPASAATTAPNLKVAFIGDQGNNADSIAVLNLIKNEGAHMVIHGGDFDYGDDPTAWDNNINAVLGSTFPYFASIGNHDVAAWPGYQAKLQERLSRVPGATCTGDLGVKSSCHYQGLFFILSGVGTLDTGHETYLRNELAADDSVWSICSWHKNQQAMQVGGKLNEVGWGAYEECRLGGAIIATAHEHSYARTKTLVDTDAQVVDPAWPNPGQVRVAPGSSFVFHSGLGGASIRDQERCLPATYPYGCNGEWASIYTSTQGAASGALFCTFNPGGVGDHADCYFKDIQGRVPDTFTVTSFMGGTSPSPTTTTPTGFALSVRPYKVKGIQTADLTWTGTTGTNVDVLRDGVKVATTANDGAYTDSTGQKGSGSHAYTVCNAGTSSCSNTVTVTY